MQSGMAPRLSQASADGYSRREMALSRMRELIPRINRHCDVLVITVSYLVSHNPRIITLYRESHNPCFFQIKETAAMSASNEKNAPRPAEIALNSNSQAKSKRERQKTSLYNPEDHDPSATNIVVLSFPTHILVI